MFCDLKEAFEELGRPSEIDSWYVNFAGFDGNTESTEMAYCQYLINAPGKVAFGILSAVTTLTATWPCLMATGGCWPCGVLSMSELSGNVLRELISWRSSLSGRTRTQKLVKQCERKAPVTSHNAHDRHRVAGKELTWLVVGLIESQP